MTESTNPGLWGPTNDRGGLLQMATGKNHNRWLWALIDSGMWFFGILAATFARFDFALNQTIHPNTFIFALGCALAGLLIGLIIGPYAVGHLRGSFEEILDISRMVALVTVLAFVANVMTTGYLVPRSVPLSGGALALLAMFGVRFFLRSVRNRVGHVEDEKRVLIFGAGEGGRQLVRALVRDKMGQMVAVGLIDDDPSKRRLSIDGVKVRGNRKQLLDIARSTEATALAVAVPSAKPELLRALQQDARDAGLEVLVLPSAGDLFGPAEVSDLRSLDLRDLLGRRPIELDSSAISSSINGKTILVTGAGGSIGSELCRQISMFGPAKLLLLDRDESALHATQISITGRGLLDSDDVVLADIRDLDRMREVMQGHRPDTVFHAAALKHLPLLEQYPEEAWKTNVIGTLNVLTAAHEIGVSTFVNVSTDKAANPSCVLGYSKRLTERLTSSFAHLDDGIYVSVRFGNVLGSRGSVITAFTAQIEQGGPVTVTHPDVERYFMLIPEACQLVLQAAAIGEDGEVMVLDMGTPSKIVDVAKTLIDLSGKTDVKIIYTGLRPGEKMSEELFTPGEAIQQSAHPLVSHVSVPAMAPEEVVTRTFESPAASAAWMRAETIPGGTHE